MDGWMDGWMGGRARLRIAYRNQQIYHMQCNNQKCISFSPYTNMAFLFSQKHIFLAIIYGLGPSDESRVPIVSKQEHQKMTNWGKESPKYLLSGGSKN